MPSRLPALALALAVPAAAAQTLVGKVWHSFSDLGNPAGTFAMNPNTGESVRVQDHKHGIPWPDGTRVLSVDYTSGGSSGDTRFTVRQTADP